MFSLDTILPYLLDKQNTNRKEKIYTVRDKIIEKISIFENTYYNIDGT